MKKRYKKYVAKIKTGIKYFFIGLVSALLSTDLVRIIYRFSRLNYPYPLWLSYLLIFGLTVTLTIKISDFLQGIKKNSHKKTEDFSYFS